MPIYLKKFTLLRLPFHVLFSSFRCIYLGLPWILARGLGGASVLRIFSIFILDILPWITHLQSTQQHSWPEIALLCRFLFSTMAACWGRLCRAVLLQYEYSMLTKRTTTRGPSITSTSITSTSITRNRNHKSVLWLHRRFSHTAPTFRNSRGGGGGLIQVGREMLHSVYTQLSRIPFSPGIYADPISTQRSYLLTPISFAPISTFQATNSNSNISPTSTSTSLTFFIIIITSYYSIPLAYSIVNFPKW